MHVRAPMILGHRGLSARELENSMAAFRAALEAGMDGFETDVRPTRDGICALLHDEDLARTTRGKGLLRETDWSRLPALNNGEPIPSLAEAIRLPARLINVELKGCMGWAAALEAVSHENALSRVIFSSFEHSEVFELGSACASARCGLLWDRNAAMALTRRDIDALPHDYMLHLPIEEIVNRPEFWETWSHRIVLWGLRSAREALELPILPAIVVTDDV